jgi:hypothetical protein
MTYQSRVTRYLPCKGKNHARSLRIFPSGQGVLQSSTFHVCKQFITLQIEFESLFHPLTP